MRPHNERFRFDGPVDDALRKAPGMLLLISSVVVQSEHLSRENLISESYHNEKLISNGFACREK
jgi:hypothetical protein